jgi:exosortase B
MSSVIEQGLLPGTEARGSRLWLAVVVGLAAMYVPSYLELARGLWTEEAYAHGPLILMVVAWLFWRDRGLFLETGTRSAPVAGGLMLALGLLLYVVGRSQGIALFEVASHIPVFAGISLVLLGWSSLRRTWFALFFLVFLIPLPGFIIEAVTSPLKNAVSHTVEAVLYWWDYPIARNGVVLSIGQYQLLVADACSGLNSLYSLGALGCLYAYLTGHGDRLRSAALLAGIVPIAMFANIVRVLILVLITFHLGDEAGQSFLHGFAGMLLFVTALLLLFGLDALLRRVPLLRRHEATA